VFEHIFYFKFGLYCTSTQENQDQLLTALGPHKAHISTIHDESIFAHFFEHAIFLFKVFYITIVTAFVT